MRYSNKLRYRNNYAFVTISAAILVVPAERTEDDPHPYLQNGSMITLVFNTHRRKGLNVKSKIAMHGGGDRDHQSADAVVFSRLET
jgi:hypothetical protein